MNKLLIFCVWLIIWFFLFKFNFVKVSPYPIAVFASIFTIGMIYYADKIPIPTGIFIIIWHLAIVYYLDEKWDKYTIFLNLIVFLLYLFYINAENESFFSVYKKIYNRINNEKLTIYRYLHLHKIMNID
jgi:hypothetical protein